MYCKGDTRNKTVVQKECSPIRIRKVRKSVSTRYTQKNGAVSKVNKKFIAHFTLAQPAPSAAATVQVSHALPAVRFSCLLRGRGVSFQDGVESGKGFLFVPFWGVQIWLECSVSFVHGLEKKHHASFLNRALHCTVITDLDTSKRSTQKAFSCCDAILETGPAAPQ